MTKVILILSTLVFFLCIISAISKETKHIPEKVLVGYTRNACQDLDTMDLVTNAITDGVNVLIWSFHAYVFEPDELNKNKSKLKLETKLNVTNYLTYKKTLVGMGYGNILHLVSFGGWDGKHLPAGATPEQLYAEFQVYNTQHFSLDDGDVLFDGIDWDLEGADDLKSPNNEFTIECLDQMGGLSDLVKKNGYIVSMAPPESYLDITNIGFSRFVNLTYPEPWHQEFQYHGRNVYAYILAKWNYAIDLIFVQFYESYAHAAYKVSVLGMDPSEVLIEYNKQLVSQGEGLEVRFEDDLSTGLKNQIVSLPLTKLVYGFANGWAADEGEVGEMKHVFFKKDEIEKAYLTLKDAQMQPRGFGFWVIENEGEKGIFYAKDLGGILGLPRKNVVTLEIE